MVDKVIFDTDLDNMRGIGNDNKLYIKTDDKTIGFNSSGSLQLVQLTNPVFTYDNFGRLSVITYSDGSSKTLAYSLQNGKLTSIVTRFASGRVLTKTLSYSTNSLVSVTEVYA
jgi:hypothetical protein